MPEPLEPQAQTAFRGQAVAVEPGSFRDRDSRVMVGPEGVFRVLSAEGLADWRKLASSRLFERLTAEGALIETVEVPGGEIPGGAAAGAALELATAPAAVLRQERVPFVSYPYEWTFAMLQDAALLELELLLEALDEEMILKDATPYNVQFRGAKPVFIDVGSFERLREGEPWAGYRQFCTLFLYPLLLQAHRGIPFQPWLRGSLEGIAPSEAARLLRGRDRLRRGILSHVHLHANLERRNRERLGEEVRSELREARFGTELIRANARRLVRLIERLEWKPGASIWMDYRQTSTYTDADQAQKVEFVRRAVEAERPALVWDLGCNDGAYARVAAESAGYVVGFDSDQTTIDALYRSLREEGNTSILPLVADLADPSPGLGWRGRERRPLAERGLPDVVLCLALVHHLAITANVPLGEIVAWLRALEATVVVEFPDRQDPMVRRLLAGKLAGAHPDYERERFERHLRERFTVERIEALPSDTRVLYLARPAA